MVAQLARVTPVAAVSVTAAESISREVAYPFTTRLKPALVRVTVTPCGTITGALLAIRMVVDGAGEGVTSAPAAVNFTVRVMVPATVPVCTLGAPPAKTAVSELEIIGTVKLAVRPPLVNCTAGSSVRPESGTKVMVTSPEISSG